MSPRPQAPIIPRSDGTDMGLIRSALQKFERDAQIWCNSVYDPSVTTYQQFAPTEQNKPIADEMKVVVLAVEIAMRISPEKKVDTGWFLTSLRGKVFSLPQVKIAILHILSRTEYAKSLGQYGGVFTPAMLLDAIRDSRQEFAKAQKAALIHYLKEIGVLVVRKQTVSDGEYVALLNEGWIPFDRLMQQNISEFPRGNKLTHSPIKVRMEDFEQHPCAYLWRKKEITNDGTKKSDGN